MDEEDTLDIEGLLDFLSSRPQFVPKLGALIEYQLVHQDEWKDIDGIEHEHVVKMGITSNDLYQLYKAGILTRVYASNRYKTYRLKDPEAMEEAVARLNGDFTQAIKDNDDGSEDEETISDDLLDIVIGHETKIRRIMRALQADAPVHLLLCGVPGTAKSLIADTIATLPGTSRVVGSGASRSGLADLLYNHRPRRLIFDELDKAHAQDYSILLELMERGTVTMTKVGKTYSIPINCMVVATANWWDRIPKEHMDRFELITFREYTDMEFTATAIAVLQTHHNIEHSFAQKIASACLNELNSKSIRQVIRMARMCKDEKELDEYLEDLKEDEG